MSPPPYRDLTVGDLLTQLSRDLPDRDALVYHPGPRYTFRSLEEEARTIARGLMALGIERGERIAIWATNVPEWIVVQFAAAKIGAILVTANTSLRGRDIDYLLRQSGATTLVTIRGFREIDYIAELTAIGGSGGNDSGPSSHHLHRRRHTGRCHVVRRGSAFSNLRFGRRARCAKCGCERR